MKPRRRAPTAARARVGVDVKKPVAVLERACNADAGRIEMHLRSCRDHRARVGDRLVRFLEGETVHTENSYKYAPAEFLRLATEAGFTGARLWQDRAGRFSVHALQA